MCKTLAEGGPCYSHTNERVRIQQDSYESALDKAAKDAKIPVDESEVKAVMDDYHALSSNANLALQIRKDTADEQVSEAEQLVTEAKQDLHNYERKSTSVLGTKEKLDEKFKEQNGTEKAEVFYHPEKDESFCGYPDADVVTDRFEYMKTTQEQVRIAEQSLRIQREAFDRAIEERLLSKDFSLRALKRQATSRAYKNIFSDNSIKNPENVIYQKTLDGIKQEKQVGSRYAGETTFYKEEQHLTKMRSEFSDAENSYHTEALKLKSYFSTYNGLGRPSDEGPRDAQDNAMVRTAISRMDQSILGSRPGDYQRSKLRCRNRDLNTAKNDSAATSVAIDDLNKEHQEYEVNVRKNARVDPVLKSKFEQEVFLKNDTGKELKKTLSTTKKALYLTPTYRSRLKKNIDSLPDNDPNKAKHMATFNLLNEAHAKQTQKAKQEREAKIAVS